MGDSFVIRADDFPIVVTVYPDLMTQETLPAYFEEYERILARGERFVSLIDMRPCTAMPGADVRREIVEWGKRIALARARLVVGVAFIVTNPLVRAALAVVHWQAPPQQPTEVFKATDPAIEFLMQRLAANAMSPPEGAAQVRHEIASGHHRRSHPADIHTDRAPDGDKRCANGKL